MGKPIDFEAIQKMMDDNPDDWWSAEIASLRFEGLLKRMAGRDLTKEEEDALALK